MEDFELFEEGDLQVIEEEQDVAPLPPLRVLMVLANDFFRDEEYLYPRAIFDANECEVTVAAGHVGKCGGVMEAQVDAEIDLKEACKIAFDNPYDAVCFVGGQGTSVYYEDPDAHMLARIAAKKSKILGAICVAPTILAKAGLLTNRRATAFPTCRFNLESNGAEFIKPANTTVPVVIVQETKYADIVTASGPVAARQWGSQIMELLIEKREAEIKAAKEAAEAAAKAKAEGAVADDEEVEETPEETSNEA
jgi:protease I